MKAVGIVLIVIGLVSLLYGGIHWTKRNKVLDLGSVEITHEKTERVPLPPIVGGVCLVAGIGLLLSGNRRAHA